MSIMPIQTQYDGYLFRSRLEARWAVFFDNAKIAYEYEPEGYELADDITFTITDYGKVMTRADTDSETGAIMIVDPLQEDDDITGFAKYKSELEERNRLLEEANFKKLRDSGLPEGTPGKLRGVVEKEDKEKPVKTGDPAHISLAIMLLLASTLVIILPLFRRRKSE